MLQLPEKDASGAVEQAGPLAGLILHPDLVSTQRRLEEDLKVKRNQKSRSCIRRSVLSQIVAVATMFTFDPGPSSQPSSWLTLLARLMAEIRRGCVTTMLQG